MKKEESCFFFLSQKENHGGVSANRHLSGTRLWAPDFQAQGTGQWAPGGGSRAGAVGNGLSSPWLAFSLPRSLSDSEGSPGLGWSLCKAGSGRHVGQLSPVQAMELMNSGSTQPLLARGSGLCFWLASLGSLGWGHTVGLGKAGTRERGEVGASEVFLTLRSGPPILFGAWWSDSGGRRRKDGHARI